MVENRASFFARLQPYHAPSTLLDIHLAYTLAKFSHRSQVRKELDSNGAPVRYFEHIRRVAIVLIDEGKITDSNMIIAALLHDGVEDTRDLTPEMIEHCFGVVAMMVKTLSKVPKEGYLERFYTSFDWRTYMIKACDRLDNLRSLSQAPPEFHQKQVAETLDKYIPLFDHMLTLVPNYALDRAKSLQELVKQELSLQSQLLIKRLKTSSP